MLGYIASHKQKLCNKYFVYQIYYDEKKGRRIDLCLRKF